MALLDREYVVSAMSLFCTVSVILRDILGGNRVFYTRHDCLAIIITDVVKLRGIIRRSCWAHTLGCNSYCVDRRRDEPHVPMV